jgi:uncharacterized protein (DUF736 family)
VKEWMKEEHTKENMTTLRLADPEFTRRIKSAMQKIDGIQGQLSAVARRYQQ